ncbi:MAG TPA: 4-phosphoerythronate dehydrogenase [Candidatus Acidoferrales bacterium]|nr:4-phosphoerythronate dehydrogenase [Candidatus Acidoferrales bacterium]
MNIVVDSAIPFVDKTFGPLGTLVKLESKAIDSAAVHDADAVVVRSETKVDEKLLSGSKVQFVGTATIGTDHVDVEFLRSKNIVFASAPGSNSNAVVQYVFAALFALARRKHFLLKGKTLGVVGVGNIGSKIVRIGKKLGMHVLQNDPPFQRATRNPEFISLDDLMVSDFITIHVPFTRGGSDPTYHLFDEKRLMLMKRGSLLINSSRGGVVDNSALKSAIANGVVGDAVLDVWENEPKIDVELLSMCAIGTPHVAGYSIDGKINATRMVLEAFCAHFSLPKPGDFSYLVSPPERPIIETDNSGSSAEDILAHAMSHCYDIEKDDKALRNINSVDPAERGAFFKRLRSGYHFRHEFSNFKVKIDGTKDGELKEILSSFGFGINAVLNSD